MLRPQRFIVRKCVDEPRKILRQKFLVLAFRFAFEIALKRRSLPNLAH